MLVDGCRICPSCNAPVGAWDDHVRVGDNVLHRTCWRRETSLRRSRLRLAANPGACSPVGERGAQTAMAGCRAAPPPRSARTPAPGLTINPVCELCGLAVDLDERPIYETTADGDRFWHDECFLGWLCDVQERAARSGPDKPHLALRAADDDPASAG